MNDRRDLGRLLLEASREQAEQPRRICDLCIDVLGVAGAGLTMLTQDRGLVGLCARGAAVSAEDVQRLLGQGPVCDAARTGDIVEVPDLRSPRSAAADRWPLFVEAVGRELGSAFAFPLRVGAATVGVLALYQAAAGDLSGEQLAGALLAADAAAIALLHLDVSLGADSAEGHVGAGLTAVEVHQATGMVQVQLGVSTHQALLALRSHAFASGRSLEDTARAVVTRRIRLSPEDD